MGYRKENWTALLGGLAFPLLVILFLGGFIYSIHVKVEERERRLEEQRMAEEALITQMDSVIQQYKHVVEILTEVAEQLEERNASSMPEMR
jgi:hypothetical protein